MIVLDASALLAYLNKEKGGLLVEEILPNAIISTVNWCEVVQKLRSKSILYQEIYIRLEIIGLGFIPFNKEYAEKAGELWQITSPFGLSLGDRACLATGLVEKMPVMTADKIWQELSLPIEIKCIR
ncbi:MAG: type II toxin-antitoxin system VapC family toxin [Dolichospermum sp. DET50]|nr:type II toxin-antitoxin system VapC family toxin [Dolichospermum sp. DET66]MBS3030914.1 type II toxin-antitoxin system VapC family toxin [Dolichospermum sp. DET67]MBS3036124.1 type II toxin-antitoxin system VapC family toxin [Dolichospermum sp. DET50]QSX68201.1 MAG: type II toxin-antitoxin system VapC family toxin [Dolichospermum sp. DET69]